MADDSPRPEDSALDDPAYAAFAWTRYRRILRWMTVTSAVVALAAWGWMEMAYGPLGWVARAAIIGGVFCTMILGSALMGLVFLSDGSGHDASIGRG